MGLRVPGEKPLRASLWETSLGHFCSRARKGRRACKVLCLWNLNSCIDKIDAKCWLAEMTFCKYEVIALGTCFSMFVYIHAHFHFVLIGRNLTAQSIGSHKGIEFVHVEFKFQRHSCQLSFLFPPHRQSTPESLLAGCSEQGWETNLRIQTLAIFMLVRGECWGPHTAPPLSFLPHFLLMYFQSLNHDLSKASCPKQQFYESSAVAQYFTLAAQLASKP